MNYLTFNLPSGEKKEFSFKSVEDTIRMYNFFIKFGAKNVKIKLNQIP